MTASDNKQRLLGSDSPIGVPLRNPDGSLNRVGESLAYLENNQTNNLQLIDKR